MAIDILPFAPEHVPGVRAFNGRIANGGSTFKFPESPTSEWLPRRDSIPLYQERFVALEGDTVRGGFMLKPQAFWLRGRDQMVSSIQLPLSEGIIEKRYGMLGARLVRNAMSQQPLLFGLGMGGSDTPVARMFKTLHWQLVPCPFFFRVAHPYHFLRKIVHLRHRRSRRLILDALAFSGLGWMALQTLHAWRGRHVDRLENIQHELVTEFTDWADGVWDRARNSYALIAVRTARLLNTLYPADNQRFLRLRVSRGGQPIGWAVFLDTQMTSHKQFGSLRVGSIIDCLAHPGAESVVIAQATRTLRQRGVDLIVTNQLHRAWCDAFRQTGYLQGPTNFIFGAAPPLVDALAPFDSDIDQIHMTRGDGDGPIHL